MRLSATAHKGSSERTDQSPSGVHEIAEEEYDGYHEIEEAFKDALDESLAPRGPDMLYDLVADFSLPVAVHVADIGCGEGRHTLRLAERFGFSVVGIDPICTSRDRDNCNRVEPWLLA